MNILVITGSPRKGNSYAMVQSFKKAAEEKGAVVKIYDSVKRKNDAADFKELDEDLIKADGISKTTAAQKASEIINLVAFLFYGIDKHRAVKHQ